MTLAIRKRDAYAEHTATPEAPSRDQTGPRPMAHRVSNGVAALRPLRREAEERAKQILEHLDKSNLPLEALVDEEEETQETRK